MEDLSLLKAGLAIVAGILAGIINTLAGSGSTITLPMLVFLGVPAHEANATNRIGVAFQNTAAVITLRSRKALDMDGRDWWLTGAMVVGSVGGAAIAAELSEQVTNWVIVVVLAVVLITILWKPEKWLREQSEPVTGVRPSLPQLLLFALIGVYGGVHSGGSGVVHPVRHGAGRRLDDGQGQHPQTGGPSWCSPWPPWRCSWLKACACGGISV